jgi:outer membrane protein TolC
LFDASIGAQVDGTNADAANAAAQLELATRDARGDAARAAIAVRGAQSAVEHAKRAEEAAGTVFALVQARYAQGLANPAELIDAETSDADARTQRTNAEMAHALGVVRLLVATGQSKRLFEEARR